MCPLREAAEGVRGTRTPFVFERDAHRAIVQAKFGGVSRLLAPLGVAAANAVPSGWRFDAVVPVPLHASRMRHRGFNQAEVVAREVARILDVPLETRALRRVRRGASQASLGAADRSANVAGVYRVAGAVPRRALLVDDVTTTGATLDAAARVLLDGGAERVYALAVARED
jgi:ComF family protein